jgi:MoxR-like ATPase
MTPLELSPYLSKLVEERLQLSLMLWGPPGIGKSSIVAAVARQHGLDLVDLRLSQLAPTDLRGLPVAEHGVSKWFPPEFLPTSGQGVLFLDEINMAPPAMQGIAQQLILDRQVGSYSVPDGWFIWAAGNRKADRAAVFEMPSALANRFIHLDLSPDLESFKAWGLTQGLSEQVLAFLAFRPTLVHQIDTQRPAWPSPRSWAMADKLRKAGLDISPAVGSAVATELEAFC